jgi:Heterokaryon incompatibility protein (HET)
VPCSDFESQINTELIFEEWISNCVKNHPGCANGNAHIQPTRLLDLKDLGDSRNFVLVKSADQQSENLLYFTLSYCWGSAEDRKLPITTRSNLLKQSSLIQYGKMPRAFQDAIDITRQLGIKYLWIDSLCIIQGFEGGWEEQSSIMGDIYAHSFCTLAASSSSGSHGGCRPADQESPFTQKVGCGDIEVDSQRFRLFGT